MLAAAAWPKLEQGLIQRLEALNALVADLYGAQEVLRAGIVPQASIPQPPYR